MRLRSAGSILCFHGIRRSAAGFTSSAHVARERLAAAIEVAQALGEIVPLSTLLARHREERSTTGLVALTFDDAYESLFDVADLLRERQAPATVFVVTRAAESGASYWWDRIEEAAAAATPEQWSAFEHACGISIGRRAGRTTGAARFGAVRQWVMSAHRGRLPSAIENEVAILEEDAGITPGQRSMTFSELTRLVADAPVDIGVHTASHPVLPLLADADIRAEITAAHHVLRERFDQVLPVLAAPYGLTDSRTARVSAEAGMSFVLGLQGTRLSIHSDSGEAQRICIVQEEPPWKLRLRLTGWIDRLNAWFGRTPPRYPTLPVRGA